MVKASISYSELELIGLEIEGAVCLWSGERQDIVMQGKNSQCTNRLGCLVDMEALLSSNKIFLEYGKRSCLGCPRHETCIDRCEHVIDNNTRYIVGMEDIRWNRNGPS